MGRAGLRNKSSCVTLTDKGKKEPSFRVPNNHHPKDDSSDPFTRPIISCNRLKCKDPPSSPFQTSTCHTYLPPTLPHFRLSRSRHRDSSPPQNARPYQAPVRYSGISSVQATNIKQFPSDADFPTDRSAHRSRRPLFPILLRWGDACHFAVPNVTRLPLSFIPENCHKPEIP